MDFRKKGFGSLDGNRRKEESRETLLRKIKAERQAREQERSFLKAAVVIQKTYRAYKARQELQQELITRWLREYGGKAADLKFVPSAQELAENILPPLLHAHLPCGQTALNISRAQAVTLKHKASSTALRGGLALALRSVAAAKQDSNYFDASRDLSVRQAWQRQQLRLMLLCGSLLGSRQPAKLGPDMRWDLTESASARLLWSLTHWQSDHPGLVGMQATFRSFCALSPVLAMALRLLLDSRPAKPAMPADVADPQATLLSDATSISTLKAVLSPMDMPGDANDLQQFGASNSAAKFVAIHILTAPHLTAKLPPAATACLLRPNVIAHSIEALKGLAEGKDTSFDRDSWLWGVANLAILVAGRLDPKGGPENGKMHQSSAALLMEHLELAVSFLSTATAVLRAATSASGKHSTSNAGSPGVLDALWPLSDCSFVRSLLAALKPSAAGGIPTFVGMYCQLLDTLDKVSPAKGKSQSAALSVTSALAFASQDLLPRMWRWLAVNLGLPLEAPAEATRGWNIKSLQHGMKGLPPEHAATLGLFCRVYLLYLLVVDDDDFHKRQQLFNLGQQRAIATALNTLVFRTHCPEANQSDAQSPARRVPAALRRDAPLLLRELYERNVRQRFCPLALWLAPYEATGAQKDFTAHGVMAALLSATATEELGPSTSGKSDRLAALLLEAPQCVPFEQRVDVFRFLVDADKAQHCPRAGMAGLPDPAAHRITVRRDSLLEDSFDALRHSGPALKQRLQVNFISSTGAPEAGVDAGGLVKEFLEEVVKAGFNADYGLMTSTPDGLAYPQPAAARLPQGLALLEFLGSMLAKALYEGILLDWPLAPFFVARLQGRRALFDDLSALDADLARNLLTLKRYDGDAEDLGLSFAVEDETFGTRTVIPLIDGGDSTPVRNDNKMHYILMLADWHLNIRLGTAAAAFAKGMQKMKTCAKGSSNLDMQVLRVIPAAWLRLFDAREVNQLLAGGESGGIDIADMAKHTEYSGGYSANSPTIKLFWRVMAEMSVEERQKLLKFATSCSRAPLGGFKHLRPPFVIHKVPCFASPLVALGGKDVERLPSASTCYNMLKLPDYRRASSMKQRLIYAVTSNTGFELS